MTMEDVFAMDQLLDLSDNDLLDLLLKRKEPDGQLANAGVLKILQMMRQL
jgi:antitoxin CptB